MPRSIIVILEFAINLNNQNKISFNHIERLYNAEQQMSVMLHSPYIGPLRDEAASWIDKLKVLDETLALWLNVQSLWLVLVPIFRDQAERLPKV